MLVIEKMIKSKFILLNIGMIFSLGKEYKKGFFKLSKKLRNLSEIYFI